MRDSVKYLFVLALCFLSSTTALALGALVKPEPVDLVQIDTGNSIERTGNLNMPVNCLDCWHEHGTQMATALEDQLVTLKARPITAKQIVWKTQEDIINAVYQAVLSHPKVILMSLNGKKPNLQEFTALSYATRQGILIIVASGNEGGPHHGYPGSYNIPCMFSVSTLNYLGLRADYANQGDSALPQMGLNERGTSYSTARMGAYAMEKFQKNPKASCSEVETQLKAEHPPARLALKYE